MLPQPPSNQADHRVETPFAAALVRFALPAAARLGSCPPRGRGTGVEDCRRKGPETRLALRRRSQPAGVELFPLLDYRAHNSQDVPALFSPNGPLSNIYLDSLTKGKTCTSEGPRTSKSYGQVQKRWSL
jgi:hypothetical protein